jgi:tetratricopeptide (TPR) repeat protein
MKKYLGFISFVVVLVAISFLPFSKSVRLILLATVVVLFVFTRRNVFFYLHANSLANSGKINKAWKWYERSIRSGLSDEGKVSVASLYVQFGDVSRGKELLDDFFSHTTKPGGDSTMILAKILHALLGYIGGDSPKALSELQSIKDSGYKSPTLTVDMMMIQMDLGLLPQARVTFEEAGYKKESDVALQEAYGRLLILERNWAGAYQIYEELMKRRIAMAPGMVHAAQCFIHYGEAGRALEALSVALRAPYNHTCLFTRDDVKKLYDSLKDPKRRIATARAIDADTDSVAMGKLPRPGKYPCPESDADILEGFTKKEKHLVAETKTERMPNTELSDADDAYLKAHHFEED